MSRRIATGAVSLLLALGFTFVSYASHTTSYYSNTSYSYYGSQNCDDAQYLADHDIISDRGSCSGFRSYDNILRQEAAAIAYEIGRYCGTLDGYGNSDYGYFSDVTRNYPNNWAYRPIGALARAGYVSTSRGYFRPEQNITNAEVLAIFMDVADIRYRDMYSNYSIYGANNWQQPLISQAYDLHIVDSYSNFSPNIYAVRGDVFEIARNVIDECRGYNNSYDYYNDDYYYYDDYRYDDNYYYNDYNRYDDQYYYNDYYRYDDYYYNDYNSYDHYYDRYDYVDYYDYNRYEDLYDQVYDRYRRGYYDYYDSYYYDRYDDYYYRYDDYDYGYYDDYYDDLYYDDDYGSYYFRDPRGGGEVRIYININNYSNGSSSSSSKKPNARDDSVTIAQDVTTVIDVLDNDTDPQDDIDEDTLDVISNPSHGTATEHSNGTITYNPDSTFTGTDSFIYEICDEDDNCDTATVTIYVGTSSGNHAPVALDDTATTPKATAKTINVIANDSDSDNNLSNTVTIVMQPSNGTASGSSNGTVVYTPNSTFVGVDTLRYQVCDATNLCDSALVTITVNNAAPTAVDDTATTNENVAVTIDLDANDTDPQNDLDPSSISLFTVNPLNGTTSVNATTGVLTYTPNDGFDGVVIFGYEICDATNLCDTASITITVNPVNEAPIANNDSATTATNTAVLIDVLANDSDPDSAETTPNTLNPASVTVTASPGHGTTSVNTTNGKITYTPTNGFSGGDSFTYQVCDTASTPLCDTASVSITINNNLPNAVNDTATTEEDTAVIIDVPANDTDPNNNLDLTSVTVTSGPNHGTTSVNTTNGRVTYTPTTAYSGSDSFSYQICDATSLCDTATVSITVQSHVAAGDARNTRRTSDVNVIINAIYQYRIDKGFFPATITSTSTEICSTGTSNTDCTSHTLIDLTVLVTEGYLSSLPIDPSESTSFETGYFVRSLSGGGIEVSAPMAENGATIVVSF